MKIKFNTDSAAFYDEYADEVQNAIYKEQEVIRILTKIINAIEMDSADHGPIMDINGNKIGEWSL